MKGSTKAIIALSVLLAAAGAWIIYSEVTTPQKIREANDKVTAAQDKNKVLEKENTDLRVSKAKQEELNTKQAKTIASNDTTISVQASQIAALKAEVGKTQGVAAAAVAQGADLKETFDAGEPIVAHVDVSALTDWYDLTGTKINPLLANLDFLNGQVSVLVPRVADLENTNADLLGQNRSLGADNLALKTLIDADAMTISEQDATISSQAGDLSTAKSNLDSVVNVSDLNADLAWTFAGATAGALGGAMLGKSPVDAGLGAVISGGTTFVVRKIGRLFHWW